MAERTDLCVFMSHHRRVLQLGKTPFNAGLRLQHYTDPREFLTAHNESSTYV